MTTRRAVLLLLAAGLSAPAAAQNVDYAVRGTVAFEQDGKQDLGLAGGSAQSNLIVNLAPRVLIEFGQAWTGYLRARLFLPTGRVIPLDTSAPDSAGAANTFAGLSEFWLQFNGLTTYPGEAFRIGRQHIRQTDNEWWDQDADALRWIFDTTLLSADVGLAHQLSTYRTDSAPIPPAQRDRTYLFGTLMADWRPDNRLGVRVALASDRSTLPPIGATIAPDAKLQDARLTWVGLFADNGFSTINTDMKRFTYEGTATYLTGHQQLAVRSSSGIITDHLYQEIAAWQASAGLRWRPLPRLPLQFGGGYVYSQGGGNGTHSRQYQQNGMQSNASYFTGTSMLIERYSETLRAELGNLRVTTGLVSLDFIDNAASLIYQRFRRDSGEATIVTQNVVAAPVNDSKDIGSGLDFVYTHYLQRAARRPGLLERGDGFTAQQRKSLVSLRASLFHPGTAYGPAARDDYRLYAEVTLWLD
jgi:alginate production protein